SKPPGDLRHPDTLVFTEEDFARYPKQELLRIGLQYALARSSFFFVGYSASDPDLMRELQWIFDHIGGGTRHFLLTDTVEPYRRRQLETKGVAVIAVGNY